MNTCNNGHLLLSKETSDVTLVIDNTELPAHRAILSKGSEYFNVMFSGSFTEAKADKIILKETNSKAFKLVLQYIYNNFLNQLFNGRNTNFEDVFEVLACAQFYMVDPLIEHIITNVKKELDRSPIKLLDYAVAYSVDELIYHSSCQIQRRAPFSFKKNHFETLSFLTVQHLLELRLNARESVIFEALIGWMRSNPDCSNVFLELLEHIDLYLLEEYQLNMLFEPTQLVDPGLFKSLLNDQREVSGQVMQIFNQNVINGLHDLRIVAGKKYTINNDSYLSPLNHKNTVIVDLKQQCLLNCIKLCVYGFIYDVSYTVSVSTNGRNWELIADHSKHSCFFDQLLYFNERPVRFIRIRTVAYDGSTINAHIEALYSTDPMEIDNDRTFLMPKQKLYPKTMKLKKGDCLNYDKKCEYIGFEIIFQLPQPCIIDTIKLLLKERSCYGIDIVTPEKCSIHVLTEVNVVGLRTVKFKRQLVSFIKIFDRAPEFGLRVQEFEAFAS